jgi:hypothetical protein
VKNDTSNRRLRPRIRLLYVLELHIFELLDHALIERSALLEDLPAHGLLARREDLIEKKLVSLNDPSYGQEARESQEHNRQNG